MLPDDPFGTAQLRDSVLTAWRDSPTRFREDANAEDDLRIGGYRDRLLVELAQNAADAAAAGRTPGALWLRAVETSDGTELRTANTGAPLDAEGVAALASLRASAKRTGNQVGRFGVGFAAVLAVSEAPRVVSATGGVRFSAEHTRQAVAGHDRLATLLAQREAEVPVLRLVWPLEQDEDPVPDGFTTDVRLPLRPGVDVAALLARAEDDAADLLLALPGLHTLRIGERRWFRDDGPEGVVTVHGPDGVSTWLTRRAAGTLSDAEIGQLGVEARTRPEWSVCWAVPLNTDGAPAPRADDVLHAPTPTDERLSLPARLFATLPVEPNRRRLLPGPATDAVLAAAAVEYVALLRGLPGRHRSALVPLPGFPLSEVDEMLRDAVSGLLARTAWLPPQRDGDDDLMPGAAVCVDEPSEELAELLVDIVPDLAAWWLAESAHAKALAALGVRRLRPADIVAAVSGVDRSPDWWAALYGVLSKLPPTGTSLAEELGGLPVPLIDGRTAIGPRDVLLPSPELGELMAGVDVDGLRIAHPAAAHPLLERLGARPADPTDLLDAPAVRDAVDRSIADAQAGLDTDELADAVLRLIAAAGIAPGEQPWLGALALRDIDGDPRRADELVLPDAPLLDVLADDAVGADAPLAVLSPAVAEEWSADVLAALGVLNSFTVIHDDAPTGPDHELADEADWWTWVGGDIDPVVLVGIRDLDLVDPDEWPAALRLLAGQPDTRRALADPKGYSAWWLARFALVDGVPLREWRLPDADDLAGLYDPLPGLEDLPVDLLVGVGVLDELPVADGEQAADLLDRLGDPNRDVPPGLAFAAHAVLARAALTEVFDPAEVDPPDRVRTLSGAAVPADATVVVDRPWLVAALAPDRVVAMRAPSAELDGALADLLNVPLASDVVTDVPGSTGEPVAWAGLGAVRLACALFGDAVPDGEVWVHDELLVAGRRVAWWVADDVVHAEDSPEGLGRALAWALYRWPDRWQLAALLTDPTPATALW
ncbi:MAG TPA: hypothetical protein VFX16_13120 [Pseudonocardiaceae bacterium]|nr:hypothetical protein [Pseudonocardiaceae bacterium]